MKKLFLLAPFACGVALACCSSNSAKPADAGSEASLVDAGPDTTGCMLPASTGIDVAFDLTCTGGCQAMSHVTMHSDSATSDASMIDDAGTICQHGAGDVQIQGIASSDGSTLTMDVSPYGTGVGTWMIGASSYFAYQNAVVTCTGFMGTTTLSMLIPMDMGSSGNFRVATDCQDSTGRRALVGKFDVTFPNLAHMTQCDISNGTFSFGTCQ
jgi:hypothetical protein